MELGKDDTNSKWREKFERKRIFIPRIFWLFLTRVSLEYVKLNSRREKVKVEDFFLFLYREISSRILII